MPKHYLGVNDLSPTETKELLQLAAKLKKELKSGKDQTHYLKNKSLGMIFHKPSLRTRVSFETGMKQLGGNTIVIRDDEIKMGGREPVADIARVLSQYLDGVMIRTFEQSLIEEMAAAGSVPIINALTDDEHPCQMLADMQSIQEYFGKLEGLKMTYIGDGNNVAHSLMLGGAQLGMQVTIGCPQGYEPESKYESAATNIVHDPIEAVKDADVVYTDVWASMGQEEEAAARKKIFAPYQVNNELLKHAKKSVIVLHCLPAHRGEEISAEVMETHADTIFEQAQNRMHAQKALLIKLLG